MKLEIIIKPEKRGKVNGMLMNVTSLSCVIPIENRKRRKKMLGEFSKLSFQCKTQRVIAEPDFTCQNKFIFRIKLNRDKKMHTQPFLIIFSIYSLVPWNKNEREGNFEGKIRNEKLEK